MVNVPREAIAVFCHKLYRIEETNFDLYRLLEMQLLNYFGMQLGRGLSYEDAVK
jgi:hypothetical protein